MHLKFHVDISPIWNFNNLFVIKDKKAHAAPILFFKIVSVQYHERSMSYLEATVKYFDRLSTNN